MGVPKFYRWISQRYPCINQIIRENEVVPIDNLYLDMNGIIHSSSHSENMAFEPYNESKVFNTIIVYMKYLITLVKPQKMLFIAIDGVAPRAKMTQQRARRFQGPKEAAIEVNKRRDKGKTVDEKTLFDSNVISPGTEFMARLHEYLKEFIARQITTDPLWRRIDIIYSGHDAPGEGEQKIREYMSYTRTLPEYRPLERHCLYGMDADLIFLGLATHEPNMCILRENVFTVKSPQPSDIPFVMVHISILREYIELEFKHLEGSISFKYNLERIIDDWIFLGYLLGNDFIPHLPNMHIHAESLTILWDTYHVVLPQLDGYLHDFGKLNLDRLHAYLVELSKFDMSWFEDREADQRWMHGKHGERMARELENLGQTKALELEKDQHNHLSLRPEPLIAFFSAYDETPIDDNIEDFAIKLPMPTIQLKENADAVVGDIDDDLLNFFDNEETVPKKKINSTKDDITHIFGGLQIDVFKNKAEKSPEKIINDNITGVKVWDDDEEIDEDLLAYRMHRQEYYMTKLNLDIRGDKLLKPSVAGEDNTELEKNLTPICRTYIKTLQWILDYYFTSVADWTFFYPYHYAPFASDLLIFTKRFVKDAPNFLPQVDREWACFKENTKPLLPFEQQLFIMPPSSAQIVPEPYRWLLATEGTPVSEFFPDDFRTDINGKLASWEAVILIPFIDEKRMLSAMAPCTPLLSPEDAARNRHNGHLILKAREEKRKHIGSEFEELLTEEIDGQFYRANVLRQFDACVRIYVHLERSVKSTFPCLKRLPYTNELKRVGVQTFSFPSKLESMVLTINHPLGRLAFANEVSLHSRNTLQSIAERFLGQMVTTGWPYSRFVTPIAILDENEIWMLECNSDNGGDQIKNQTFLRTMDERDPSVPFWSSLRWLQSQAERIVSRLKDRCAINLSGQPRAALICRPAEECAFTADLANLNSSSTLLQLRPISFKTASAKKIREIRGLNNRGCSTHGPQSVNKSCLRFDANVSVKLGPELSLEILDLTIDNSTADFHRKPIDLFPAGTVVGIFADGSNFARFAEVVDIEESGWLSLQLKPEVCRMIDPDLLLNSVTEADDATYLTIRDLTRALRLTMHVIWRLIDDFIVLAPVSETRMRRRNQFNIGLGLRYTRNFSGVVGWSRFSSAKDSWVFSNRTLEALQDYAEQFPEVIDFVAGHEPNNTIEICNIFPNNTYERFRSLKNFLRIKVRDNRTVTKADALFLDMAGMRFLESSAFPNFVAASKGETQIVSVAPTDVLAVLPEGGRLVPTSYMKWIEALELEMDKFYFLDRVIYVGQSTKMFGLPGVIIGCYPVFGEEILEVMFDTAFDGAISIRGSPERCDIVAATHLLHYPLFTKSSNSPPNSQQKRPIAQQNKKSFTRHTSSPISTKQITSNRQQQRPARPPSLSQLQQDLKSLLPPEWLNVSPTVGATTPAAPLPSRQIKQNVNSCIPSEWIQVPPALISNTPVPLTNAFSVSSASNVSSVPLPGLVSKSSHKSYNKTPQTVSRSQHHQSPQPFPPIHVQTSEPVFQPHQRKHPQPPPVPNRGPDLNVQGQPRQPVRDTNVISNLMNFTYNDFNNNNINNGYELLQHQYPPPQVSHHEPQPPPCLPPTTWQTDGSFGELISYRDVNGQLYFVTPPMVITQGGYQFPVTTNPYDNEIIYEQMVSMLPVSFDQQQLQSQQHQQPYQTFPPSYYCPFPPPYGMDSSYISAQIMEDSNWMQNGPNLYDPQYPPVP